VSIEESKAVERTAIDYFWGWQQSNWAQLRATLAPDVEFEDPRLERVEGVDAHVALYSEGRRFPDLTGVAMRRLANSVDVAFVSYDVYLGGRRTVTVIDQLSVREGRIVGVLSVTSEWPPREPSRGDQLLAARAGVVKPRT
jgi:hypothetical protein